MGRTCAVHRHRDDVPLEVHHIWPRGRGGADVAINRVTVCANGHSAIHELLTRIERAGTYKAVPWRVRIRFGFKVRRLALQGWSRYGEIDD